jgi:hypothetical protein
MSYFSTQLRTIDLRKKETLKNNGGLGFEAVLAVSEKIDLTVFMVWLLKQWIYIILI